jgi:hypothetical protein
VSFLFSGRYTSLPMQDEHPPSLPERNLQEVNPSRVNNAATQKLHEILTTPRKPKSHSPFNVRSPIRSPRKQQQPSTMLQNLAPMQRNTFGSGYSPSSFAIGKAFNFLLFYLFYRSPLPSHSILFIDPNDVKVEYQAPSTKK